MLKLIIFMIISFVVAKKFKEDEKPAWAKKDIKDYNDADLERLLDQWEDDEPNSESEQIKPPSIDLTKLDMSNPEEVLKQTKKGQTIMMFVTVANKPSRARTEELTKLWATGLWNAHIQAERYLIDDDRAIFMFKDGSQAWDAKDFLLTQEELKYVQLDSRTYEGTQPNIKNRALHDEL